MIALGFDAWWPAEKLSLFGYVDVLMNYRELVGIRNALGDRLVAESVLTYSSAWTRPTSTSASRSA